VRAAANPRSGGGAPAVAPPRVAVRSTRFGELKIPTEQLLRFPLGLPGFTDATRFALVEHRSGSRFRWLQSVEHPEAAFLVIDPMLVEAGFPIERVRPAIRFIDLEDDEEVAVLVICCVPSKAPATVNLMAPIGIGLRSRRGAQVILHETGFTTDEPLVFEDR
jgi:flagellar assembly factor FliW